MSYYGSLHCESFNSLFIIIDKLFEYYLISIVLKSIDDQFSVRQMHVQICVATPKPLLSDSTLTVRLFKVRIA